MVERFDFGGQMTTGTATQVTPPSRKVGFLLGVGIMFIPIIFAWFLLRAGYSTVARFVGLGWMALILLIMFASSRTAMAPQATVTATNNASVSNAAASPAVPTDPSPTAAPSDGSWRYSTEKDDMRGTVRKFASIDSDTVLNFHFPYNGGAIATLTLRKSPVLNVILEVNKGQFLCDEYGHSYVSVKFDSGPIEHYSCSGTSDGRANEIFIDGEKRFLLRLRRSSKVIIEPEFYQDGRQQIAFDVHGLKWD